ncbi:hypothetical protein BT96DRAFT_625539 [Gymnopus androsaceus JB14]|uniref:Uncharacterized protein n=1 Tax=Gymnopus androsaceus JB14 TaxID=1447944 RepID=A0A6A4IE52_9AGAR|nr:hypothetical protein BT96DRAFT_625539 [Gymnopus androsaceus JB14]
MQTYPDKNNDFRLCYQCLTKFITDHLHLWVIMKRKEAKEKVADDCMATTAERKLNYIMPKNSIICVNQSDDTVLVRIV